MATDITYRGEDRLVQFQVKDGTGTPIDWAAILNLVLVIFYDKDKTIARFCKAATVTNYTTISLFPDAVNGIFQIYLYDEVLSKIDPSRVISWAMKVTVADANSADGKRDEIDEGELTIIQDSIVRNIKI